MYIALVRASKGMALHRQITALPWFPPFNNHNKQKYSLPPQLFCFRLFLTKSNGYLKKEKNGSLALGKRQTSKKKIHWIFTESKNAATTQQMHNHKPSSTMSAPPSTCQYTTTIIPNVYLIKLSSSKLSMSIFSGWECDCARAPKSFQIDCYSSSMHF